MATLKINKDLTLKSISTSINDIVALPQVPSLSASTRLAIQNTLIVGVGSELNLSVADTETVIKLVLELTAKSLTAHTAAHKK